MGCEAAPFSKELSFRIFGVRLERWRRPETVLFVDVCCSVGLFGLTLRLCGSHTRAFMATGFKLNLLEDPVGKTLVKMSAPTVLGILFIILFNVVDTFYVGQLGKRELAAMSFTFPVTFVVISAAIGLSMGSTTAIARAFGSGDKERVATLTTDALFLGLFVVVVINLLGLLTLEPLFMALGATEDFLPLISNYMTPWYLGSALLVVPIVGNGAIRATGDTKSPAIIMGVAGFANMILDPLLIFGLGPFPRLELFGAALATVSSWSITMVAALWILGRRERMLRWDFPSLHRFAASWKPILFVGLPAAGSQMLVPVASGVLTRLVSAHGADAVAAFGVGQRLESLSMVGMFALGTSMTAFAGQNSGARRGDRLLESLSFSLRASVFWCGAVACLLALGARPIAELFSDDSRVIEITMSFLYVVPLSYVGYGFTIAANSTLMGMNRPVQATVLIVGRLFVLMVPAALLGSRFFGIRGLFAGIALANLGALGVSWLLGRRVIRTVWGLAARR